MNIKDGYTLLLPAGILEYFEIERVDEHPEVIHIFLVERNEVPTEYRNEQAISKGFFEEIHVQDFPLRGRSVYLHVRRRRWQIERTKEYVSRDWSLVAQGTRMTQEFASFLKEIHRY
jgi:transposase